MNRGTSGGFKEMGCDVHVLFQEDSILVKEKKLDREVLAFEGSERHLQAFTL